ncbi:MAG: hypothetical protein ACRELY_32480 [Polyangiaceae bacterium]
MADSLQARAEDLFCNFMAPLVLGGELRPGRILGAKKALAIGAERTVGDIDLAAHVTLARVRVARKIAPVDRAPPATPAEWALAACLHDLVQSTHPSLYGTFRRSSAPRIVELVDLTLARILAPADAAEALWRHTWFSRALEIARTDTKVSYWIGSQTFRGDEPPARLLTWPELRRVHVQRSGQNVAELAPTDSLQRYQDALLRWLVKSPLTDLAHADRALGAFAWSESTIALVANPVGRTLAARTLRFTASRGALPAIERATTALARRNARVGAIAQALVDEARFFAREEADRSEAD